MARVTLIEAFRLGDRAGELGISAADLRDIADGYDTKAHEAPLTLGHPADNAPAYGWIKEAFVKGKSLFVAVDQIADQVAELVKRGAYKKVSVSLYKPESAESPTPGKWALRHVGLLGAVPPAIKGMRAIALSGGDVDVASIEQEQAARGGLGAKLLALLKRDRTEDLTEADLIAALAAKLGAEDVGGALDRKESREQTNRAIYLLEAVAGYLQISMDDLAALVRRAPEDEQFPTEEEEQMNDKDKARFAELEKRNEELAAKNEELAKSQAEAHLASTRAGCEAFAEQQVAAGRVLPKDKAALIETLVALKSREDGGVVKFADGDETVDLCKWLQERIAGAPAQVDYSERAGAGKDAATVAAPANFASPDGALVDERRMALHRRAQALAAANNIDYAAAVGMIEASAASLQ